MRSRVGILLVGIGSFVLGLLVAGLWRSDVGPETEGATSIAASRPDESLDPPKLSAVAATPERTSVDAEVSPDQSEPNASAQAGELLVFGTLLDAAGKPIGGSWHAGVAFADRAGRTRSADAKEGSYAISGLEPGRYWVSAEAEGFRRLETVLDLEPSDSHVRRDFTLQKATVLRIKASTPEGGALVAALVESKGHSAALSLVPVATLSDPGPRIEAIRGSSNNPFGVGQFSNYGPDVEALPPGYLGLLYVKCDLPVNVSLVMSHAVLQTRRVEPGAEEVVFVVAPEQVLASLGKILVRVLDADTQSPIEEAWIQFDPNGPRGPNVKTGPDGSATMEPVAPVALDLWFSKSGYERLDVHADVGGGETLDLGTILLEKGISAEVRFLDADGNGVAAQCILGVLDAATGEPEFNRTLMHRSDGSGVLKLAGLGRRLYVLQTIGEPGAPSGSEAPWMSGNVLLDTRSGSVSPLEVRLKRATQLVLLAPMEHPEELRFRVIDEGGLERVSSRFYGAAPRPLLLPPALYRVLLIDPQGRELARHEITLGTEPMELALAR